MRVHAFIYSIRFTDTTTFDVSLESDCRFKSCNGIELNGIVTI